MSMKILLFQCDFFLSLENMWRFSETWWDRTRVYGNHEFLKLIRFPLSLLLYCFYLFVKPIWSYNTYSSNNPSSIEERKCLPFKKSTDLDLKKSFITFTNLKFQSNVLYSCCYSSNKHALPFPFTEYQEFDDSLPNLWFQIISERDPLSLPTLLP